MICIYITCMPYSYGLCDNTSHIDFYMNFEETNIPVTFSQHTLISRKYQSTYCNMFILLVYAIRPCDFYSYFLMNSELWTMENRHWHQETSNDIQLNIKLYMYVYTSVCISMYIYTYQLCLWAYWKDLTFGHLCLIHVCRTLLC